MEIFPLYLAGPLSYFEKWTKAQNPQIDLGEHFIKQSFRNRYEISGPNGKERLIVPLEKGKNQKMAMKDVRISYAESWTNQHKKAIQTAYGNTAFYDYYGVEINEILDKKHPFLIDLSQELFHWCLTELGFPTSTIEYKNEYIMKGEFDLDYRGKWEHNSSIKYPHIYDKKYELETDLSLLDLLFHEGRASRLRFL